MGLIPVIKKRSFSFMLAKRYLNPRRSVLSSFTLISLVGVMLGVLVLVVVMAVYAGLERDIKGKLLGFTPHILVKSSLLNPLPGDEPEATVDWHELATKTAKLPGVAAATAFVSDYVLLDVESYQRPVAFRGVDTTDPAQVKGVEDMLDKKNFPESTADLGLDDRAVISSIVADQYKLQVGDKMRLYSTRNFDSVFKAYSGTKNKVVREAFPEEWSLVKKTLGSDWKKEGELFTVPTEELIDAYNALRHVYDEDIRNAEREMLDTLLHALEDRVREENEPEDLKLFRFTANAKKQIDDAFKALVETDEEKLDAEAFRGMEQVVLPKEVEVAGIYSASQMAMTPELFVPLPLAQDLAGLGDQVQGIALRLDDPYKAEKIAAESRKILGSDMFLETWGDQYQAFFSLINQQRVMMYFALSFIVLVSAFSMMAVMFTVTIQKRREIGVMKALGAAPGQIVRVFLYQGMILGILGSALGVALGRLVIHFRGVVQEGMRAVGFDPFSASLTGSNIMPAHNDPVEQLVIAFMAFVLCSIAALVPAFFAARSDAAKSLRNL